MIIFLGATATTTVFAPTTKPEGKRSKIIYYARFTSRLTLSLPCRIDWLEKDAHTHALARELEGVVAVNIIKRTFVRCECMYV